MSEWAEVHLPCPDTVNCGSSDAYCIHQDGHGFCFSCNKPFNKEKKEIPLNECTYEYLPRRGISKETHEFFNVKTQVGPDGKPTSVAYTYPKGAVQVRNLEPKGFYSVGKISEEGGWGPQFFPAGSSKAITITEGNDDAMSAWEMLGKYPVYSVKSVPSALSDVRRDYDYLNSFDKIYLALDSDEPGQRAAKEISSVFGFNKVYLVKLTLKDPHEYLEQKKQQEFKNAWFAARKLLPDTIESSFKRLKEAFFATKKTERHPWPFPSIQRMTGGIEVHRQYLLTGLEGIGKTEFLTQTIAHLAKTDPDANIGIVYLEAPNEETITMLAGKELKLPVHLEESPVSKDEVWAAYERLAQKDDRLHLFKHFGSEDSDVLLGNIRFLVAACGCKYIFFDNYQIAVSGRGTEHEREQLDYLSTRMEMLVKELPFSLIAISHENDNELTRGSRNLSKTCDVWINMKRDIKNENEYARNIQYLTIFKNRQAGKTGPAGRLIYDQATASLTELTEELPT